MKLLDRISHQASQLVSMELFKYIGPGFFVTVGFIDPGNWVTNVAAGSQFGYRLLWVVTLSTIMLIVIQHNAAHLGIVTGLCLSEAASEHLSRASSRFILATAMIAAASTALAELLGSAIGLQMLFGIPIRYGAVISSLFAVYMLFSKNYQRLEKWIISFVSLIGIAFIFELSLADILWKETLRGAITPQFPASSILVIMGVLGAVIMPHNIFLHSEVIQSRQWNRMGEEAIQKQLKYEFYDTLVGMTAGWGINSAMIIMSAAVFFSKGVVVTELQQVTKTLEPLFGQISAVIFALGLLFAGLSSSVTAAMAGGSIYAGIFKEPFDMRDNHSRAGLMITIATACAAIFCLDNPFRGILWSQVVLSIQLPFTLFPLIYLTSSAKVMGKYANPTFSRFVLLAISAIIVLLNFILLKDLLLQ